MSCNVPSFITAPPLRLSTSPCHSRSPAVYSVRMAIPNLKISRRELGTLVLGASAVALSATFGHADEALAESAKKPPAFVTDESGVKYFDVKEGTGARPIEGDFVVIDYLAFLSSGKIFDNRKGFVFQMGQRQVIPGLESAVASMKPGGQRKVVIPPTLAYGQKGVCFAEKNECLVPPGETLGYDVTLLRVAIPPT